MGKRVKRDAAKVALSPGGGARKGAGKKAAKGVKSGVKRGVKKGAKKAVRRAAAVVVDWRAAHAEVIRRRSAEGRKLTQAELDFMAEFERESSEFRIQNSERRDGGGGLDAQPGAAVPHGEGGDEDLLNYGATLEEDLEEWVLRDGVVRGAHRRLSALWKSHQVEGREGEKVLWRVQRRLLTEYGFEGAKKSGPLEGVEALAMQWVKSIGQLARASAEWELQMEDVSRARLGGKGVDMERFAAMVGTLKALVEKRDGLALKVRELSVKERKASVGRGKRAQMIEIVVGS